MFVPMELRDNETDQCVIHCSIYRDIQPTYI